MRTITAAAARQKRRRKNVSARKLRANKKGRAAARSANVPPGSAAAPTASEASGNVVATDRGASEASDTSEVLTTTREVRSVLGLAVTTLPEYAAHTEVGFEACTAKKASTEAEKTPLEALQVVAETREATDHPNSATDWSTTTDRLSSGEYYTGRDITLDSKLVTTVEVWQVAYRNDRRDGPLGVEYQVLWVHPDRSCKKLYMRSWEPRAKLMEDGFEGEMDLVYRWKASEVPLFETFWREDDVGMGLIGADEDGLCVFNALRRASELAGRPDIVTQQDIDQFVDDELILYGRDLSQGARWKVVLRFLGRLRDAGRDFAYNQIATTNHAIPGRRGAQVLEEIPVDDGIYIVGAYNHRHIGHEAVLTVQGAKLLIYDLKEGNPISSAKRWINFYAFVRPFKVFK
ncbi:hypothetical protein F441_15448 [Phytophthora nicotianae CJ01A1]|uniref:Uncharacterized protein n=1 Tax=Phytophthora nicotianae CJ01A1 TaxID=1317063 RepID=W2WE19_PHYNI|nr:hypothetical protein F441_15448 [Phytophthora nicotianae CJ01A1]